MMNGIELSHLYKCLHPSIDQAPLVVQHGLATLTQLVLGQDLDKHLQQSNWGAEYLHGGQLLCIFIRPVCWVTIEHFADAQLDGVAGCLIYAQLAKGLAANTSTDFTTSSYSFNAALLRDGVEIVPGPGAVGGDICVWGVGQVLPAGPGRWRPRHVLLDQWRGGAYAGCRDMDFWRFSYTEALGLRTRMVKAVLPFVHAMHVYLAYHVYLTRVIISCILLLPLFIIALVL